MGPAGTSRRKWQISSGKRKHLICRFLITDGVRGGWGKLLETRRGVALYIDVQLFPSGVITQKRRMINFES